MTKRTTQNFDLKFLWAEKQNLSDTTEYINKLAVG
jgi:hypothetical protein